MIVIDPYSRAPIYEQVIGRITELIMVGELKSGDKLPSVRMLARDLGVNPNTIQKAYAELERRRIIYTVSGKGNFVGEPEVVSRQVCKRLLEEVGAAVRAARRSGIEQETISQLVNEVYEEKGGEHP
ncbi:MAG: GntR family transcriptional regulator [Provencibacterium sp.]|nr:GntR family transcriptional regulator [Provencibacterium sp.]